MATARQKRFGEFGAEREDLRITFLLVSHSGMVEIPRLQAKRRFVMPANTGIQIRSRFEYKNRWIQACAGMTETEVDSQSTNSEPLGLEPRVVQFDPWANL